MARPRRGTVDLAAMTGRRRGFALLIVLWTVGFLALLGTQIVAAGRSDTRLTDNLKQEAVLQAATDGAVARVMFAIMAAHDPSIRPDGLVRQMRIGQTPVLVRIQNEADRINLNTASGALLRAFVIQLGEPPAFADQIAAAILDWRTAGANPRPGGAKATDYRAAGRSYGPPEAPFQSVDELADVLGVSPALYARMEPHLTVLTDSDPDMSTRDPIVARALADAAGVADVAGEAQQLPVETVRIYVTAIGTGAARYSLAVVASADFQSASPRLNILLRQRGSSVTNGTQVVSGVR
jgi:general secretion pathway protein K